MQRAICCRTGLQWSTLTALVVAALTASVSASEPLIGRASVIDGDTIEIQGQRIRLNGIDAPESNQLCLDAEGGTYRCGQKASFALADWLDARQPIACNEVDRDRYRRIVAICTARGVDVADWMVRQGHAMDWPQYSSGAYASAQKAARAARRGMWSGSFARPWEWRKLRGSAPMISASGS